MSRGFTIETRAGTGRRWSILARNWSRDTAASYAQSAARRGEVRIRQGREVIGTYPHTPAQPTLFGPMDRPSAPRNGPAPRVAKGRPRRIAALTAAARSARARPARVISPPPRRRVISRRQAGPIPSPAALRIRAEGLGEIRTIEYCRGGRLYRHTFKRGIKLGHIRGRVLVVGPVTVTRGFIR